MSSAPGRGARRRMADVLPLLRPHYVELPPFMVVERLFDYLEEGVEAAVLAGYVERDDENGELLELAPFLVDAYHTGRLREVLVRAMAGPTAPVLVRRTILSP